MPIILLTLRESGNLIDFVESVNIGSYKRIFLIQIYITDPLAGPVL